MTFYIRTVLAAAVMLAMSAANSSAEVMDKQPSLAENWIWSAAGGLLAVAAWRWRWWSGLPITSIVLVRLVGVLLELQDPVVGPAIRLEAGERYVTQFYLALAVAVVLHAVAVYLGVRRTRADSLQMPGTFRRGREQ